MANTTNNTNTHELPELKTRKVRDAVTEQRIMKLHPKVRDMFRNFIADCEALDPNTVLRITQGLRTFEEQQTIYNQGRTTPGNIVSNAKPGQSFHNYGLAIDLVELDGAKNEILDWKFDTATLKPIADKYGIKWGGTFSTIKDKPHFEKTFGYTWQQLLALRQQGKLNDGYVIMS